MRRLQLLLLCSLLPTVAFGYARPVHRRITASALALAAQSNDFIDRLGTSSVATYGTGQTMDVLASEGADQEDNGIRSLNHFLDPVHGDPLKQPSYICLPVGARADNWADDGLLNQWSFADAKVLVRQAIVGSTPTYRDSGYRDLFKTLGHGVHLVQDMAQPEHTRNDQHLIGSFTPGGSLTPGSLYETWVLEHLSGTGTQTEPDDATYFVGSAIPVFPSYKEYFTNADKKGMADFANANFVTQDTNYDDEAGWFSGRCETYTAPDIALATRGEEQQVTETVLDSLNRPYMVTVPEIVFSYMANDLRTGVPVEDAFHTHLSSLDYEVRAVTPAGDAVYSLSNHSYASRARILLPRAVEYSAGLVNHFFRGKVAVTWSQGPNNTWDMTITNAGYETIGADAHVVAVYKATPQYFNRFNTEDTHLILDDFIASFVPGFGGLASGESVTLSGIPVTGLHTDDSLMQFERRIVVIGSLGNELDVVMPLVQGVSGMKVRVDAAPAVVTATLSCSSSNPAGFRSVDISVGTDTPFAIATNEQCRVMIQHQQQPAIDNEGVRTTIQLKVWRGSQVVEDLGASIDAGDVAVGGCHRPTTDGHCDRFIQRTGSCVYDSGWQNNTKCTTTIEQWDWGTGPY